MQMAGLTFFLLLAALAVLYFAPLHIARYLNRRNRLSIERRFNQPVTLAETERSGKKLASPYSSA